MPLRRAARLVTALASVLLVLAVPAPARASDAAVQVTRNGFGPRVVEVSLDGTVTWDFSAATPQSSTSDQGFWSSDPERTGGTYDRDFTSAGRFAYHSRFQPDLHGAVEVPVQETGSALHGYQLRWSTVPGGRKLSFDVQVRPVSGTWTPLRLRTKDDEASYAPSTPGRYQVRARTDRGSSHAGRSGWSPAVTVTIS